MILMKDSSKCGLRIISLLSLESEVIYMTKREEILYMENEKLNRAINKDSGVEVLKMNAQ